ncbi:MAG: SIR2 family protein [Oscillospiraceae bacterium]|nr:SIR2 family protein [Oscillospiraceae bacterium]
MASEKTVYILGAGASASTNLPVQSGILRLVFSLNRESFSYQKMDEDFLSIEINESVQKLESFYPLFDSYRCDLGKFIVSNFAPEEKASEYQFAIAEADLVGDDSAEQLAEKDRLMSKAYELVKSINTSLEDLFTIFDSVSIGREHFRLYSPQDMDGIHTKLKMCIIYAMAFCIATDCNETDYLRFARHLLSWRLNTTQKEDTLAVITMNWDDVLERMVFKNCEEYNSSTTRNQIKIYPDLCFYNYDYHKNDTHIPSTHIKARGNKNIKILKMHGSLAWLECPKCGRIMTDFATEIAFEEFGNARCPYCSTVDDEDGPKLRSLIITPTFLKSLNNLNVKNIWQNAYIDISEADHVVFIGYSLPDADFEMRCLLKKAIKDSADIKVVLTERNDPTYYEKKLRSYGVDQKDISSIISRIGLPYYRYISFFGEDKVSFEYGGFGKFLDSLGV